jgi:pimeloyl-ACP methyl ester carboxylesterase
VTSFVLVPGAWHGGWCWQRVSKYLGARQHDVFALTLTGLCERSHLLSPKIDLTTHIMDVVNFIKWRELKDIVLVGHSYGGMVVSGVAELMEENIASIVLVDAFYPKDGQRLIDLSPRRDAVLAAAKDGTSRLPPVDAAVFNVNAADQAWVNSLCTAQPIRTFLDPVRLSGARDRIARRRYIRAAGYPAGPFDAGMAEAAAAGWKTSSIDGGHDLMIDSAEQLSSLLMADL